LHLDVRLAVLVEGLEGEELDVLLNVGVGPLATHESFDIENRVFRIRRQLILGGVADEAFLVGEGDVRGGDSVALVVGDDFDAAVFHHSDAKTKINKTITFNFK
jgi:hypothetical protein